MTLRLIIFCAAGGSAVLKAQILAGGRGKGAFNNGLEGGVHKVDS